MVIKTFSKFNTPISKILILKVSSRDHDIKPHHILHGIHFFGLKNEGSYNFAEKKLDPKVRKSKKLYFNSKSWDFLNSLSWNLAGLRIGFLAGLGKFRSKKFVD